MLKFLLLCNKSEPLQWAVSHAGAVQAASQVTAVAEARALKPLHWGMLRFLSVYSHFSQNLATLLIVKELFCCLLDLFSLQSDGWIWTLSLQAYQGNILTKGIDLFQCKTFWKPSKKSTFGEFWTRTHKRQRFTSCSLSQVSLPQMFHIKSFTSQLSYIE